MASTRRTLLVLAAAAALLLLWGWLLTTGTILVVDRGGALARAEVVTGLGVRRLRRLPGGLWVGIPDGDGTVRLVCRDGSWRDHGYVSPGIHEWLRVAGNGRCGRVEPL